MFKMIECCKCSLKVAHPLSKIEHFISENVSKGAAVVEWLSSWLAEQGDRGSIPGLATWILEIGYLLLPSRDMAKIPLKRRKSSIWPTKMSLPLLVHTSSKGIDWIFFKTYIYTPQKKFCTTCTYIHVFPKLCKLLGKLLKLIDKTL